MHINKEWKKGLFRFGAVLFLLNFIEELKAKSLIRFSIGSGENKGHPFPFHGTQL